MWSVRQGHEHNYIDGRTHVHHVHLANAVTGGEFNLELLLGCSACPSCKRPFIQSDLSGLDPAAEINEALSDLMANHSALMEYAGKHGHPIRLGPLAEHLPAGHRITVHGGHRLLHAPRVQK